MSAANVPPDFRGKRVTVMGLGRFGGGVGVARFLVSRGADVLVTDTEPEAELSRSVAQLAGLPVRFRLGGHDPADFSGADLVVVNPAVDARDNPYLQAARQARVPLTSEMRLLLQHLPRPRQQTIGITGSAGKSTTTAMIGQILRASLGEDRVHIGGNLGGSLLGRLDRIRPDDWVVLELSSFMLEAIAEAGDRWSPHIAVLTNVAANHLDRHGTFEAYARAKQEILEHQGPRDYAVIGPNPPPQIHPRTTRVAWLDDGISRPEPKLAIPGEHNLLNARMAIEAATCAGVEPHAAAGALATFTGLPHRLQLVCEHDGVRYFNDSKATTPEAAEMALRSFPAGVVHAILGGYDKKSDLGRLAQTAANHCRGVYTIGATGDAIAAAAGVPEMDMASVHGPNQNIHACGGAAAAEATRAEVVRCGTLERALAEITPRLRQGDVVLLSPGCASWDQYENFEQRGNAFAELVLRFTGEGVGPRAQTPS